MTRSRVSTQRHLMMGGRAAFLVAAASFIWWGLRGHGDEVRRGLEEIAGPSLALVLLLILLGLIATGVLWLRILRAFGHVLPIGSGLKVFFVGQLGKYIPGSIWSLGAQADGTRRFHVPVRESVAASAVFLGVNVATATALGFAIAGAGLNLGVPRWAEWGGAALSLAAMTPSLVSWLARRVAGGSPNVQLGRLDLVAVLALMAGAWASYAAALVLLTPLVDPRAAIAVVAGFLLAYAAGVVVVIAPAGLGAREAVFVAVAGPVIGLGNAAALAVVSRVLFTVGDVLLAVAFAFTGAQSRPREKAASRS